MLSHDRSQWTIEELKAEERAEDKRWERVQKRAADIRHSATRLSEVIDEHMPEIAQMLTCPFWSSDRLAWILHRGSFEIAEREIPPVSLQDIADELAGDINNEPEFERGR